jgi:hypothetical protein
VAAGGDRGLGIGLVYGPGCKSCTRSGGMCDGLGFRVAPPTQAKLTGACRVA